MWRLTIHQKRKSETSSYELEEKVSYESEEIAPLLIQVSNLSKLDATGISKYEIYEVPPMAGRKTFEEHLEGEEE